MIVFEEDDQNKNNMLNISDGVNTNHSPNWTSSPPLSAGLLPLPHHETFINETHSMSEDDFDR